MHTVYTPTLLFHYVSRRSALLLLAVASALFTAAPACSQTFTNLYSFLGPPADGDWPCGVARGPNGGLISTTMVGGLLNYGTVSFIDSSGAEQVLHSFDGSNDGQNPCAPLTRARDGKWYGTAEYSGNGNNGYGTVFSLQSGTFKIVHTFNGLDGTFPKSALINNADGFLYGTTAQGGGGVCPGGCGTVFKIDALGNETVVYSFSGPDGAFPSSALIHDGQGNLYGTTLGGGLKSNQTCPEGCGTVFKLTPNGKLTVLYKFTGGTSDGWYLVSGVVLDQQGNLYGTTASGGTYGLGIIYEITSRGVEKILHNFQGAPDGGYPQSLVRDKLGNFFGATYLGGTLNCPVSTYGCGTIFEYDVNGAETVLHQFTDVSDGAEPSGPVYLDAQGNLWGTTIEGIQNGCSRSSFGCGTVWKLALGSEHAAQIRGGL